MSESPAHEYVVVARRYRPQSFDALIGQEHVARALTGAIASERVGHAYLFTGARGVGKTSAARILAKALNCLRGTSATPCNECEVCLSVAGGDDVDVIEIDGASNRGIDEIRQLRQNVAVRPSRARFKIYIIDEVHMLTKEAFNALLKTLEEPPEHVKFIFATTEPNKIPITILSRCQRYDFAGIDAAAIQRRLAEIAAAEGVEAEDEALAIIAVRAAGSMRDSQSLLEQLLATGSRTITSADVTSLLGLAPASRLSRLVQPLVERDAATALAELDAAIADGAEPGQLVDQLLGYFRDAMTQAVGCSPAQMLYALPSQRGEVSEVARQLGIETLLAISQILDHAASRMRISTQVRTLTEMALVRICQLENLDALATLVEQLKGGAAAEGGKKNSVVNPPRVTPPRLADLQGVTKPPAPPGDGARSHSVVHEPAAAVGDPPAAPEATRPTHVAAPLTLDAESAERLWKQALELLPGMAFDHASAAERIDFTPDGRLTASFPETTEGKFHRDRCVRVQPKIESALAEAAGRGVGLQLTTHAAAETSPQAPMASAPSAAETAKQLERSALESPFVAKAMELFAADASRVRVVAGSESERS
jgi:DNA polymerase-3 subunit gamma/tau